MLSNNHAGHFTGDRMTPAPIALFAYNRPVHTRQTIESLRRNALAGESELIIFSDGPRPGPDRQKVESVRDYLRTVTGFKKINIVEREKNAGLAQSIISGVTEVVNRYGRIIVLEDDMLVSPFFLEYMNEALEFYEDEERVISIHAYLYPLQAQLPETFFLRGADCWGWATWKRGWALFEPDGLKLLAELKERKLVKRFDLNGTHAYTRMLKWQARGALDSWAIRWHASAFLRDKLTLFPGVSLIANIGLDASGAHCSPTDLFDVALAERPVKIGTIPIEEHAGATRALENYYRTTRPSLFKRAARRLARLYIRRKTQKCGTS
jgi:hypothetical protein